MNLASRLGSFLSFIVCVVVGSIAHTDSTPQSKFVSDDLVSNLQCANLNIDEIYRKISRQAFHDGRRIVTSNSEVIETVGSFGDCWSLSRWQRLALLLGRSPQSGLVYDPKLISNFIRGSQETTNMAALARFGRRSVIESPLTRLHVFQLPQTEYGKIDIQKYEADIAEDRSFSSRRSYYNDIHTFQRRQFYRLSNLYYVVKQSSDDTNESTLAKTIGLAKKHRLPMIIIRSSVRSQHVVLVSTATKIDSTRWQLKVIDPNEPLSKLPEINATLEGGKWKIDFTQRDGSISKNVDIFLVGEDERPLIDQALMAYYRSLCAKPQRTRQASGNKAEPRKQPGLFQLFERVQLK